MNLAQDLEAQNGVIHIINKVIFPPNKTVLATLKSLDSGGDRGTQTQVDTFEWVGNDYFFK